MSEGLMPEWVNNSIAMNISRDTALMFGMVEPTPEEAAEREERSRRYRIREREAWLVYDEARTRLAAIDDSLVRKVLDLHAPTPIESPKCEGCDMDGYECESPEWPCRTTRAIAEHYDIALPDVTLWRRPEGDA